MNSRVERTWFCPITDSMRINSFLKLNNLRGHDYRPDWRSLVEFGDPGKVTAYIARESILGIVLLEDFVGGGSQMTSAIEWAANYVPHLPILVVPLVCCPAGVEQGKTLASRYKNVTFSPVLKVREPLLLKSSSQLGEPAIFRKARDLITAEQHRLDEWHSAPFGWDGVGAIISLFTNCPDNTLPIIFHSGPAWEALFPRLRRG